MRGGILLVYLPHIINHPRVLANHFAISRETVNTVANDMPPIKYAAACLRVVIGLARFRDAAREPRDSMVKFAVRVSRPLTAR